MNQRTLLTRWLGQNVVATSDPLSPDEIRALVADDLAIESVELPQNPQTQGVMALRGRLRRASHEAFPRWLEKFNQRGYTPLLRHDPQGPTEEHVVLRIAQGVAAKGASRIWINILLFILTLCTTTFAGLVYGATELNQLSDLLLPSNLIQGFLFSGTLLGILTAHEFGHYFAARYHKVRVTLPYFIPLPFGIFGTMGAFIQMKEPISDRRKLFDIGIAGPLAGLVLAIPLLFIGLSTSPMLVPPPSPGAMLEGNSIVYYFAKIAVFGKALPNPITGEDVMMNNVTFAAWFGLLVTALNLLPVGQLDGGHAVFALFGNKARYINIATMVIMALLGIAGLESVQQQFPALIDVGFLGWFVWLGLIFFIIGPFHPPALDDVTELDPKRRLLGYAIILIFILTFVPVPLRPV